MILIYLSAFSIYIISFTSLNILAKITNFLVCILQKQSLVFGNIKSHWLIFTTILYKQVGCLIAGYHACMPFGSVWMTYN